MKYWQFPVQKNRILGLDLLRSVAILSVMIGHGASIIKTIIPETYSNWITFDGVSIFFVLSGFLIGKILIDTLEQKKATPKVLLGFWLRRWLRTLPAYLVVLVFLMFSIILFSNADLSTIPFWKYFLFLQNFNYPTPPFFGESWSLAVEEWFYLLVPLFIFSAIRIFRLKPAHAVLLTIVIVLVFCNGMRIYKHLYSDINTLSIWDYTVRKQVLTRLDSIIFGLLGAYLYVYHNALWSRYPRQLLVAGIALLLIHQALTIIIAGSNGIGFYMNVVSFSIIALATLLSLPYLNALKEGPSGFSTSCNFISTISYSMYLLNLMVVKLILLGATFRFLLPFVEGNTQAVIGYILFWAYTIIGSALLYKLVEKPFIDMRNHIRLDS